MARGSGSGQLLVSRGLSYRGRDRVGEFEKVHRSILIEAKLSKSKNSFAALEPFCYEKTVAEVTTLRKPSTSGEMALDDVNYLEPIVSDLVHE